MFSRLIQKRILIVIFCHTLGTDDECDLAFHFGELHSYGVINIHLYLFICLPNSDAVRRDFFLYIYIYQGVEKQILQGAVEGKRGRCRPPISWTDEIKKVSGQGMKGATQMADERVAWRALVKTTARHFRPFFLLLQCAWFLHDLLE